MQTHAAVMIPKVEKWCLLFKIKLVNSFFLPKDHPKSYMRKDYYLIKRLPELLSVIILERITYHAAERGN